MLRTLNSHRQGSCAGRGDRGRIGIDIHPNYFPESYPRLIEAEGGPLGAHFEKTPQGPKVRVGPIFAVPILSTFIDLDECLQPMNARASWHSGGLVEEKEDNRG
jgi:hypothetical protein